jgi:hypothetical protein
MLLNSVLDHILTCLRAHILIIGREDYTGFILKGIGYSLYVYRTGDITAAPTYKNTNSLHLPSPPLLRVFSECADDSLLRKVFVKHCGNHIGCEVVSTLLSYNGKTNRFHELRGLYASGASVDAGKAGKAFIDGL